MSTLKVDNIRHNSATSDAITMASDGTCTARITGTTGGGGLSHRNILINGSCAISQRGTSFSGTGFTLDRYYVGSGDYSVAQVTDAPSNSGLTYSLRISRTASTTGYLTFQMIELPATGQAGQFYNGAKFTLSGYVKGTSGATIIPTLRFSTGTNGSNGSSFTRTEGAFTCNGSWQSFTFHFTVDENVGGSDKCVQSYFTIVTTATGQNVFFTGLQLEAGDTATSFEHRSIGDELARCQRYCVQYNSNDASRDYIMPAKVSDADDAYTTWQPPVAPRTTNPSISYSNASHLSLQYGDDSYSSPINFYTRDNTAANPFSSIVFLNFDINENVMSSGDMVFLCFTNNTSGGYLRFEWEL